MKEYIVTEHPDFPYEEPKPQELIRCKDCKWYMEKEWVVGGGSYIMCRNGSIANAKENDYCSRAERKEE